MHRCSECGYTSRSWFGVCPQCRNGMGEAVPDEPTPSAGAAGPHAPKRPKVQLRTVDPTAPSAAGLVLTPYPELNAVLSTAGGMVEGQVAVLAAPPGVGKSTLCASVADHDALYVSTEESYQQVNGRFLRVHPDSGCAILATTSMDAVMGALEQHPAKLLILDSLNSLEFGASYARTARMVQEITSKVKQLGMCAILVSQVTKKGNVAGMMSVEHVVDTVLHLDRATMGHNVVASSTKNRFGEVGSVAMFEHAADSLREVQCSSDDAEPELGMTRSRARFGYKNLTVGVEALVANTQFAVGMRRSNGYPLSRVQQITAILDYFSPKADLRGKDVYVAISQGLNVSDANLDMAVANSILSSLNGEAHFAEAHGELALNGAVKHGSCDGAEMHHVGELIASYGRG